jgi:hypothetical protein
MKKLLFAALQIAFNTGASAAVAIPAELTGIWATEGARFYGQALMQGQALYLGGDGVGASIGGDGKAVIGVRLEVTSYDPDAQKILVAYSDQGKIIFRGELSYDPVGKMILTTNAALRYRRYFETVSVETRKSLGLETTR